MKVFTGKIISVKMQGTATVLVQRHFHHPLYGKILKRDSKILAANQIGAVVADEVTIVETRPIAKTVCFRVKEILTRAGLEQPATNKPEGKETDRKADAPKAAEKTAMKRKRKKEVEK